MIVEPFSSRFGRHIPRANQPIIPDESTIAVQVQPAEVTTLVGAFADSSSLAMTGIKLGGVKYMYLRGDAGRSIYGRKV